MPLTITLNLSDDDVKCLENDLLDIQDWCEKALIGKVNNCKKRMVNQGIQELRKAGQPVPADDMEVVKAVMAQPGYMNRKQREARSN